MRELFPNPADDVDPVARYESDHRPPPADRPWLLVNMVTSVDGATAVDGRSGALGSAGDHLVIPPARHALEAEASVIRLVTDQQHETVAGRRRSLQRTRYQRAADAAVLERWLDGERPERREIDQRARHRVDDAGHPTAGVGNTTPGTIGIFYGDIGRKAQCGADNAGGGGIHIFKDMRHLKTGSYL